MKKFAFINQTTGEISNIAANALDTFRSDGAVEGDLLVKEIPVETDDWSFMQTNYWRNDQWNTREASPGVDYIWTNYAWAIDTERLWVTIRNTRDIKLGLSDWTQVPDSPLSAEKKTEWATYRAALRNVPAENASVQSYDAVNWPTEPS